MPVGFGDVGGGVIDDELAEDGEGRRWDDHGPKWLGKEEKKDVLGGYTTMGKTAEEKVFGGRRGSGGWQNYGMTAESSNKLLPTAGRKGHWEVVGKEDRTSRR